MSEGLDNLDKMINEGCKSLEPVVEFASDSESPPTLHDESSHLTIAEPFEMSFLSVEEGRRQWLQALVELNIRYMLGRQHPADDEV